MADGSNEDVNTVMPVGATKYPAPYTQPVQLEPFIHQVGGHSSMLRLDETTVCKPLIQRELDFYEMLPEDIKKFTPQHKGMIKVSFVEDAQGYITITAYPPNLSVEASVCKEQIFNDNDSDPTGHRIRLRRSGSIEIECPYEDDSSMFEELDANNTACCSSDNENIGSSQTMNPWVLKCHREHLRKIMKGSSAGIKSQKFLLLENLTWKYQCPCILDLKMGTRQYGDDASPAKVQSQTAKVEATTSSKLGIRICGMQVYQVNSGNYICRNKYHGRMIGVDRFKDTLLQFLHNGKELRTDLIVPIIERLKQLHCILAKHDTFRFYTSSLLIIYDGVASSSSKSPSPTQESNLPKRKCNKSQCSDNHTRSRQYSEESVDVRMIDFAHSTRKGFDNDILHHGPDRGYMFGLENLISFMENIEKEYG